MNLLCLLALIDQPIDEKNPLYAELSTTTHNRISHENGGIEKIFADGALFSVAIDPTSGSAFITPLSNIEQPVTVTVVTSSGLVQDLSVTVSEKTAERICLKDPTDEDKVLSLSAMTHKTSIDLINALLEKKTPHGYGIRPLEEAKALHLPAPLQSKVIQFLEGPFETLCVYELSNPEPQTIVLHPEALQTEQDAWVFLSAKELEQNKSALFIVGQLKE